MTYDSSFATEQPGPTPDGWTAMTTGSGSSHWTVEKDDSAPSRVVLRQTSTPVYPLALKDGSRVKDGFVEVSFKTIAGFNNHVGGVVWRAQDAHNYYVVRADALESNIVVYKTVDGARRPLDIVGRPGGYGVTVPIWAGRWHGLRVEFEGSRFKVFFNGSALLEVEDTTFADAGQVGLWTKADGVTLFDGFAYGEAARRRSPPSGR